MNYGLNGQLFIIKIALVLLYWTSSTLAKCKVSGLRVECDEQFIYHIKLMIDLEVCSDDIQASAYLLVVDYPNFSTDETKMRHGSYLDVGMSGYIEILLAPLSIDGTAGLSLQYYEHEYAQPEIFFRTTIKDTDCNFLLYWFNSGANLAYFLATVGVAIALALLCYCYCYCYNKRTRLLPQNNEDRVLQNDHLYNLTIFDL